MDRVCPVCNEIKNVVYKCKKCGGDMVDKGRKQEYYDDYSADDPIFGMGDSCQHLFKCTKCDYMEDTLIKNVMM